MVAAATNPQNKKNVNIFPSGKRGTYDLELEGLKGYEADKRNGTAGEVTVHDPDIDRPGLVIVFGEQPSASIGLLASILIGDPETGTVENYGLYPDGRIERNRSDSKVFLDEDAIQALYERIATIEPCDSGASPFMDQYDRAPSA